VTRIAIAAALVTPLALSVLSWAESPSILAYVSLAIAGTLVQLRCLRNAPALTMRTLLSVAVLAHLLALAGTPAFEDDHYRFVWDGWRTIETGTPYGLSPQSFFDSETLPAGYADILSGINYPEYPTIYGPVLQIVFAAGVLLTGSDAIGIRILFAGLNLCTILLLLRRFSPVQVALYAWSPVAISEVALHAHPDGIVALFVLAAIAMAGRRPILSGIFLGMAAGAKIVAVAAWPLLLRSGWPSVFAAVLTSVALYAPFMATALGAGFESTATFATEWRFNPLGFAVLESVLGDTLARLAAGFTGVMLILLFHAASPSTDATPLAAIFAVVVLVSPAVNAWYILWVLPFAVGQSAIWPWLISAALPLSYLTGLNLDSSTLAAFQVHPVAYGLQVIIILFALVLAASTALRRAVL
jgi:hypothetical protein